MAPIQKAVEVTLPVTEAFAHFTSGMASWWPLSTHAITQAAPSCTMEGRVGGRVFETAADGSEHEWGEVRIWEPPHRVVFGFMYWRGEPGTEVEVRFTDLGDRTRLHLEHRHWERLGGEVRGQYDPGWDYVLGCYTG